MAWQYMFFAALFFQGIAFTEVTYRPKPLLADPWKSDSIYIGAGVVANDSTQTVVVKYIGSRTNAPLAAVYYVENATNTPKLIYRTDANTSNVIELGPFPKGTLLTFLCEAIDTLKRFSYCLNKKSYSGQNRVGIDSFISDSSLSNSCNYGLRRTAAGRIGSNIIEIGFMTTVDCIYREAVLNITNVYLEGLEKHKLPQVKFSITESNASSIKLNLFCPVVPDTKVVKFDTLVTNVNTQKMRILYTIDGSNPLLTNNAQVYLTEVNVTRPALIRAAAVVENDTTWLNSDVSSLAIQATSSLKSYVLKPLRLFRTTQRLSLNGRTQPSIRNTAGVSIFKNKRKFINSEK